MDFLMLGKGKGKKGKGDKKGKGKGKANAKTTKHFPGKCLVCKVWRYVMKDCWWNESAKSRKDTASAETPITPVANTAAEPSISGMPTPSDEGETVPANPAQWLYAVTKREPGREEFLNDSGGATSVCQQSLADSLRGKPRGPGVGGTQVSHWTSVHNDRQHDDSLACTRRCQRCGRLSDCA